MTPPPPPFIWTCKTSTFFWQTWLNLGNIPPKTRLPTAFAGVRVCCRKAGGRVSWWGCRPTVWDSNGWLWTRRRATASQSHSPPPRHADYELFCFLLKKVSQLSNTHLTSPVRQRLGQLKSEDGVAPCPFARSIAPAGEGAKPPASHFGETSSLQDRKL